MHNSEDEKTEAFLKQTDDSRRHRAVSVYEVRGGGLREEEGDYGRFVTRIKATAEKFRSLRRRRLVFEYVINNSSLRMKLRSFQARFEGHKANSVSFSDT